MKLVIVESPTKAKTISKFLGKGFMVESSFGHIRDLPKSDIGIDIEHDFKPRYVIPTKAKKTVTKLKKAAEKADEIILASDEDREGEAIAWHLAEALKIPADKISRIVFHEITKEAIQHALETPRQIDQNLVDAQQARRVLDRLVGYELSPFLWKKVARGLSAGRVQSVALKIIVDREKEIDSFETQEYWSITAQLITKQKEKFNAELVKFDNKSLDKLAIKNKEETEDFVSKLKQADFIVESLEKKRTNKSAPAPFITSSLQQAANRTLGFSAKQTMMLAQQLYEGIELGSEGSVGLITYMRTDSLNLSENFLNEAREHLIESLGKEYALDKPRHFKTKAKGAQEAHEAIRPSSALRTPESIKDSLAPNQFKLYKLIWQRAICSQMPEAQLDQTAINIKADKGEFKTTGQTIVFPGWLKLSPEKSQETILPEVSEKEKLELEDLISEQHFTKAPARYSDATLVKELEKHGIGRPSTYAPTISTIEARNYVTRDEHKRLKPTDIAKIVIDLLAEHFKNIVDVTFTAKMENDLDEIADGKILWQPIVSQFYGPFHENLQTKYELIKKTDIMPEQTTEEKCDKCGSPMLVKTGRFGPFLACSNFPECRNIKSMNKDATPEQSEKLNALNEQFKDEVCSKCGSKMVVKNGRFGPFLACSSYPKCKNIKNIVDPNAEVIKCPVCKEGHIIQKRSRRGIFWACDQYPDCKTAFNSKPTGDKCPDCGEPLVEGKDGPRCSGKGCDYGK
ncbi:MAG: type I DNA topoisomerase [Candidatus Falkowbacteria bacterium]|nr:type I DNA topoisomerase [Candidatus Falkowbacteria bacterium]